MGRTLQDHHPSCTLLQICKINCKNTDYSPQFADNKVLYLILKMAFQAPSVGQGRANRKILEELEEKKKMLQRMNSQPSSHSPAPASTASPAAPAAAVAQPHSAEVHPMTAAQRSALQHAHANSVGYFITQDSSYGNLILPVLPRFEK